MLMSSHNALEPERRPRRGPSGVTRDGAAVGLKEAEKGQTGLVNRALCRNTGLVIHLPVSDGTLTRLAPGHPRQLTSTHATREGNPPPTAAWRAVWMEKHPELERKEDVID